MQTLIQDIARIVEAACAAETNAFGYGIWSHHITRVVYHGRCLAAHFHADPEIIELAALLHDYASIKDATLYAEHHWHSQIEAERLLRLRGYPEEKIVAVTHCIAAHRASVRSESRSAEATCLATADAIAHVEQVPALLYYVFVQRGMGITEGTRWVRQKLERSWQKLSPAFREQMRVQYEAALATLILFEPGPA